jgi:hypothetical protein
MELQASLVRLLQLAVAAVARVVLAGQVVQAVVQQAPIQVELPPHQHRGTQVGLEHPLIATMVRAVVVQGQLVLLQLHVQVQMVVMDCHLR